MYYRLVYTDKKPNDNLFRIYFCINNVYININIVISHQ